ncbi:SWIM-type domain-containing protein [Trichonephila clavipes]|nr:SWIM-type domain-containing protein [Trichonephila clavipes]
MDWPAYSPDLNSTEHVWDALGRRIAARLHHPENTQQLKQILIEEWALLPQEMLHQLVLSMRRRRSSSTIDLKAEFKRLLLNKLQTINGDLINFITIKQGISTFTFNWHSLTAHAVDLQDSVIRNSNILVLSETWLGNESDISIPNFNCIVKYKRPNTRAGGVAIYQISSDAVNIITPSMECSVSQSDIYGTIQSSVVDLCLAECVIDNGKNIIIVAVYITPNKKLDDIIEFLHRSLLPYTSRGSALINENYDKIPMILYKWRF